MQYAALLGSLLVAALPALIVLIITRNGQQSVVMLSLDDYKALEETAYLLRNPANARRLLSAVEQLNAGKGVERKLAE